MKLEGFTYGILFLLIDRGQILHSLGDELQSELPTCLPIFLDRLRNEITRLTTVKAYTLIAG
jgi:cullin-associated NEDD8-dissociated protein 1